MASSSEKSLNFNVQCSDDLVATETPLDLQIEIITRLPAKSLMRFKCVSRLWSSLIRSRYLSNRHLTVPSQPRLYMSLVEKHELGSMEVCNNPRESVLLSLSSSSSDTAKSFDQDLTMPGLDGDNMVALHGLILHNVCGKACIYNPTTRQSVTLPAVKSNIFPEEGFRNSVFYFFGHDPVLDKYKVVCTFKRITSEHWVFVLEVGGSWKRIEFVESHIPDRPRPGLCINGVIYYLASSCMSREIVVSFDVRSEELNMIRAPDLLVYSFGKYVGFIEYGGKPAIFDHTYLQETGLVELWVLEDGGIWSRKYLGLQPCQMHLVDNINLAVEGTTQNGEVILAPIPMPSPYYILYYDLQKNDLRKVNVRGISDHWFSKSYSYFVKLMDKSESIMHLET